MKKVSNERPDSDSVDSVVDYSNTVNERYDTLFKLLLIGPGLYTVLVVALNMLPFSQPMMFELLAIELSIYDYIPSVGRFQERMANTKYELNFPILRHVLTAQLLLSLLAIFIFILIRLSSGVQIFQSEARKIQTRMGHKSRMGYVVFALMVFMVIHGTGDNLEKSIHGLSIKPHNGGIGLLWTALYHAIASGLFIWWFDVKLLSGDK
jgi:hypothetical protein